MIEIIAVFPFRLQIVNHGFGVVETLVAVLRWHTEATLVVQYSIYPVQRIHKADGVRRLLNEHSKGHAGERSV